MEAITNPTILKESKTGIICPSPLGDKQKEFYSQINDLSVKDSLTVETVAEQISKNLNESNKELIYKIVRAVGIERALKFYDETRRIEQSGGIYYKDGSKRKTPGGVFFYVVHNDESVAADENLKKIFAEESHKKYKLRKDQIKEERKRRTEELRARIMEEGLLSLGNQKKED